MKFSILYVNFNSVELIKESIKSLLHFHKDLFSYAEIIVVDNCSGDDLSGLHEVNDKVTLVYNDLNGGFGAGNNIAFNHSCGDLIILVNPDVIFIGDITSKIENYYSTNISRQTDIVGGNIFDANGKLGPSYKSFPSVKSELLWFLNKENISKFKISDDISCVDMVSGAFCCIPRNVYDKLNGFDEDYFLYFEEMDLQYRHFKEGNRSVVLHNMQVVHYESSIVGRIPEKKLFNISKGRLLYHRKNSTAFMQKYVCLNRGIISLLAYVFGRGNLHKKLMYFWWKGLWG